MSFFCDRYAKIFKLFDRELVTQSLIGKVEGATDGQGVHECTEVPSGAETKQPNTKIHALLQDDRKGALRRRYHVTVASPFNRIRGGSQFTSLKKTIASARS